MVQAKCQKGVVLYFDLLFHQVHVFPTHADHILGPKFCFCPVAGKEACLCESIFNLIIELSANHTHLRACHYAWVAAAICLGTKIVCCMMLGIMHKYGGTFLFFCLKCG
jgi:hypothetical protein